MKMKKLTTFALAAALAIGTFGISVPIKAAENSTDYTITIPATLTVAQSGWNATDGITAQVKSGDTFDTGKKLTVTAESTNSWALKSGNNSVGYNLATATGTYSSTAEPASWEFSATDLNANGGKTNPMGIIVEDYSSKPAGTYQDTVTFTAKVEDAVTTPTVGTVFPIGTADLGDYYYWEHDLYADRLSDKFRNFGNATISISSNYSHPTLGNYRVIRIESSTAQYIDWQQTQMDPSGPWATWQNGRSINYFKVDNYDTTPTGIRIASGSGTEDDPFTFELVFD